MAAAQPPTLGGFGLNPLERTPMTQLGSVDAAAADDDADVPVGPSVRV